MNNLQDGILIIQDSSILFYNHIILDIYKDTAEYNFLYNKTAGYDFLNS